MLSPAYVKPEEQTIQTENHTKKLKIESKDLANPGLAQLGSEQPGPVGYLHT